MSKILAVFGVTGQQGGSVANFVLNDPILSKEFKVRGITRDPTKPAAVALKERGVEIVVADYDDKDSLKVAVHGVHTVFAVTVTVYDDQIKTREYTQGKAIVDASVTAGVKRFIFSTLPHIEKISGGKYKDVYEFDSKSEIEDYVRSQSFQYAFIAPGSFMQTFSDLLEPQSNGDGTFSISNIFRPDAKIPLIDINDAGLFVGAILANPEKYQGKTLAAVDSLYSYEEVAQIFSKSTGKTVNYNQLSRSEFETLLPPESAEAIVDMLLFIQDFGYYGSETEKLIEWSVQNARGNPKTLEEYLALNPVRL